MNTKLALVNENDKSDVLRVPMFEGFGELQEFESWQLCIMMLLRTFSSKIEQGGTRSNRIAIKNFYRSDQGGLAVQLPWID
jgi:hypothetical protein